MEFAFALAAIVIIGSLFIPHKKPKDPQDNNNVINYPYEDNFYV